jgi:hypothetical protein
MPKTTKRERRRGAERGERSGSGGDERETRRAARGERERSVAGGGRTTKAALTRRTPQIPKRQSMGGNYFFTICVVISVLAVMSKLIGAI